MIVYTSLRRPERRHLTTSRDPNKRVATCVNLREGREREGKDEYDYLVDVKME